MHFGWTTRWLSICVLAALMVGPAARPLVAAKNAGESKKPAKTPKEKPRDDEDDEEVLNQKEPTTFADALDRGKIALDQAQGAKEGVRICEEQKDTENLPKLRKEYATNEAAAYRMFHLALTLADKGKERPDIKAVNEARYFLCFLNFQRGNYYYSAVIGEFLARHTPDAVEGRQGARIALASFVKLFGESKLPDKDKVFEIEHIQQIAELITKQWPNEEEAQDAAVTLLNFAIQQHQLDKAIEFLKQIPEKSPGRTNIELRLGQALWLTYQRAPLAPPEERPTAEQLERFRSEAEKTLSAAVERLRKQGEVNPTIVGAMLSLAQIYLDMSENDKAVAILEDKQFGPLTLVKSKDPSTSREGFAVQTYIVALRAYVATQNVKDLTKIMNSLEKRFGKSGDPKAAQVLTQIYIGLGHELQQHLERLRQSGNKKELEAVSNAFEAFLNRIVERGGGNSFNSLIWVAETFYSLATNFDDVSAEVPQKAKGYYANAVKGYEQVLARAAEDPKFVPNPENLIGIRLRAAISERRIGNYSTAIKLIAQVLEARPKMITAQIEGAETYQMSGVVDQEGYLKAIAGGERTPKGDNYIWGWGKLAKMTQDDARFEDTFYMARLKIAECRFLFALKAPDKAKHDKYVEMSKKELSMIYRLYPKLGGPESYAKYDQLAKKVQTELGEKPVGMQEFKDADAQSAPVEK